MPSVNFYDYLSVTKTYILFTLKILLKFVTENLRTFTVCKTLARFRSLSHMRGLEMIHSTDQADQGSRIPPTLGE